MGFSLAWVAVRGKDRDAVLKELRLRGTGKPDEAAESDVCGLRLPSGWYVVHMNDWGEAAGFHEEGRDVLRDLSLHAEVVYSSVEEHVMHFDASYWRDGTMAWRVEHDGDKGARHLAVSGKPPPEFDGIRRRRFAEQDEGDRKGENVSHVSDIPLDLAELLTGFRHDGEPPEPFEILEPTEERAPAPPARRGCLLALAAAAASLIRPRDARVR